MIKLLFFYALVWASLQTNSAMTYTFPFNPATPPNRYFTPAYELGTLSVNYSITISITLPNLASTSQLSSLVAVLALQFVDSSLAVPIPVPAVVAGGAPFIFPPATSASFYSVNYTVSFPSTFTAPMATFILKVTNPSAFAALKFDYYYLQVRSYPSNQGQSVNNQGSVTTLVKVTEVMRDSISKVIYIAQSNFVYSFTLFPAGFNPSFNIITDTYNVKLYRIRLPNETLSGFVGNDFTITPYGEPIPSNERIKATIAGNQPNYNYNVGHYQVNILEAGFYLLQLEVMQEASFTGSITFSTDPYACPYSASYSDYYLNFQGCSAPTSTNGAPCIGYNPITQMCALCLPGYTLVNGTCFTNTDCPDRQYYRYGTCYQVSAGCGNYDRFTGDCLTCANSNYTLVNGTCVWNVVTCGPRQWKRNNTCFDVADNCATFSQDTGKCLNCTPPLQVNANGTCYRPIICGENQYLFNSTCLPIPAVCVRFDTQLGVCLQCVPGYYVRNGVCQQILCPPGQVPSQYSVTCVDVSPLCGQYDPTNGNCITCKYPGYTVRNGACVQIVSPLAGCRQRQALGFGSCVGADVNCQTFNLISGNCDVCIPGYYIDYTGKCYQNVNCSSGQWSVNGQCLAAPANCQSINQLGFCTVCSTGYRLIQGQCVYFQQCGPRQYLKGAVCFAVSGSCATWNPTSGNCITCKTAGTFPTGGVCCPPGQIFSGDSCIDIIAIQYPTQQGPDPSACVVRHPSLNFCLQCGQGYAPDYSIPFACAPQ